MFDFSLQELGLVGLVALIVMGPREMVIFMRSVSSVVSDFKRQFDKYFNQFKEAADEIESEANIVDVMIDEEGNPQRMYDVSKIMPKVNKSKVKTRK